MIIKDEKLVRNALRCNACLDEIVSVHRHDFNSCKCGAIAIDGGLAYTRRVGDVHNYTDLSVYEEFEREERDWEVDIRLRKEDLDRRFEEMERAKELYLAVNCQEKE